MCTPTPRTPLPVAWNNLPSLGIFSSKKLEEIDKVGMVNRTIRYTAPLPSSPPFSSILKGTGKKT